MVNYSSDSDEDKKQSLSSEPRYLADLVSEEDSEDGRDNIRRKRQLKPHSIVILT